jgi:plasmid maintenance system antidote protein VapI
MKSSGETGPSAPTPPFVWEKYFGLPAQFWLNLQNDYDLRIAEGNGIGKGVRPRKAGYDAELSAR